MNKYSLSHLSDQILLRDLGLLVTRDRVTTAVLLAHLAEVDARKLYLPAGYPSMYLYCVQVLRLSEDASLKRIQASRIARRFPQLFDTLAEGRIHLTGVGLLAPYLTAGNSDALIAAARDKTKAELLVMLAERFPQTESLALIESVGGEHAPAHVGEKDAAPLACQHAPAHVDGEHGSKPASAPAPTGRSSLVPLAPQRFELRLCIGRTAYDQLRYAERLLSHQIRPGDLESLLQELLTEAIPRLEKKRFAATDQPRRGGKADSPNARHIPAEVRRAVWRRDRGRCTFVSEAGHACASRDRLEFDHIRPVARGGKAAAGNLRLRCRAHNQYEAERAFGTAFMEAKRAAARERDAAAEMERDILAGLRDLGIRGEEARRALEASKEIPGGTLEERLRAALRFVGRRKISTG